MKLNRAWIIGTATAGALLLLPGGASAATLKGNTSQPGKHIELHTRGDESVKYARIKWTASCRGSATLRGSSTFKGQFDRSTPQGFRSSGSNVDKDGNYKFKIRSTIEGAAKGPGYKGTFEAKVKVLRKGQKINTCKTGTVRWTAHP
jgi:hypothetical protein